MATLLLLRHAKAQPDAPAGDHRRVLTKRGVRDARAIGAVLAALPVRPDVILTSDAARARQTAQVAAEALGVDLREEPRIYGASVQALLRLVRRLPEQARCVVLVGHNPGLEELAALLAGPAADVGHLPTAGLARLEFDVARWRDVAPGGGRVQAVHVGRG